MSPNQAPVKTEAGQAELAQRSRHLSQRQRTLLFLVDGRRSADEVRSVALQAGVPDTCFDELVSLGLVSVPGALAPLTVHVELPLGTDAGPLSTQDSLLPAVRSMLPESGAMALDSRSERPRLDLPLAEARTILVRAVRNESPVAGLLTIRKLERAASRSELEALLDEVEHRISKPRKQIVAAQTMRHVRHLLSLSAG